MMAGSPTEQAAIHARCVHPTGTFTRFSLAEIGQSVAERFEESVRRNPDRLALRDATGQLSYDELNKAANRIANALLNRCWKGAEPVGLLIEKSTQLPAAILGALKAGKI